MNIYLSADVAGPQQTLPNIIRAIGQASIMAPLSALAVSGIERENAGSASSLYNMMRNLGGAIGIAMLQTIITKREQFHSAILTGDVSLFDPATRARLDGLAHHFMLAGVSDPARAWHEAVVAVGRGVRQQASIMAYSDAFFAMGAAVVVALAAVACLKRGGKLSGGGGH